MKLSVIERILVGILLIIAIGIVVHAPLTVWLGTMWPAYANVIKAWKEVLMGFALVLLIVVAVRRKMVSTLLNDRLVQVCLVYAGLHFVMVVVIQNGLQAASAGLLIDLRYILYFALVYATVKLLPGYRYVFIKAFFGGAGIVLGFALLQLFVLPRDVLTHIGYGKNTIAPFLTVDQNNAYVRINSTLRGPNPLGAYAVMVLSLVLSVAVKYGKKIERKHQWLLGLTGISGLLVLGVSYSRSSLIGAFVALAIVGAMVVTAKVRQWLGIILTVFIIVIGVGLFALRDNSVVSNLALHDNGGAIQSDAGHAESLQKGIVRFIHEPLGNGIGSTGSASLTTSKSLIIENQYLFTAHETGWLGLGIFLWLFGEIMYRLWIRRRGAFALAVFASGWGLAVIGLLLPVWVDDTVSIIWWGMAAVAVAGMYNPKLLKVKKVGKAKNARKNH